jgi:serine protease AprX
MRRHIPGALALFAVALLFGCGGNDTYNPALQQPSGPNFSLAASPSSRTVVPGGSTTYSITATATGGFSNSVSLSISGLPAGAGGSFNPSSVTPTFNGANSTLTVTTTGGNSPTPDGTYTLTVTATDGNITRQTTVTLVVASGTGNLNGTIQ